MFGLTDKDNPNCIYILITELIWIVHVALFIFFFALDVMPMVYLNISSIATYTWCLQHLRTGRSPVGVFYATYLEILIHAFMAVICVGYEFGFAQYMIGLIPFGYHTYGTMGRGIREKYVNPTFMAGITLAAYLACRWIGMQERFPIFNLRLTHGFTFGIYSFNTLCIVIFLIWSACAFLLDTNRALKGLEAANTYLKELAYTDPLTGLYNRRHMMELFDEAGDVWTVIMCDIDKFKSVNDTYGHDFGDVVLKETAAILKNYMNGKGFVSRWGGEEVVILHKGSFEEAVRDAEGMRMAVEEYEYMAFEKTVHCSMTVGVSMRRGLEQPDDTIKRADNRLYWGKEHGRNRVVSAD